MKKDFLPCSSYYFQTIDDLEYKIEFKYDPAKDQRAFIIITYRDLEILNSWISLTGFSMAANQSFYISHFAYNSNHKQIMIEVLESFIWIYQNLNGDNEFAVGTPKWLFNVFKDEFRLKETSSFTYLLIPKEYKISDLNPFPWMILVEQR